MAELLDFLPLFQETLATVRARYDSDANAGLDPADEAFLDTTVGGFYFDLTQPSALEAERLWDVVATVLPASIHPAFAWGDYLDEWAVTVGIARKPAVRATGEILISGEAGTAIASGTRMGIIQSDPDADPIEFFTTITSTTLSIYPGVTALTVNPQSTAGRLTPATYYYRVAALTAAGETVASLEASAVIPAQLLAQPSGLASTAFTTGGTLASGTYYYKVTALNANGQTIASTEHSRAVTGPTGRVDLTWGAVPGATSYRIYRGTSAGGQNTYYTSATNSYSDTGSAGTAGTPPSTNTAQVGQVSLDWADFAGATAYRVYRSTAPNEERFLEQIGAGTSAYVDDGDVAPSGSPYPTNTMPIEAVEPGASGNVPPNAITLLLTPVAGASVTNPLPTSGGADVETDELLRERVLLEFSSRPGAGTVTDYERWALGYAPVGYATVEPLWNGPGTVRLSVTDQDNNPVAPSVVTGLQLYLDPVPGQGRGLAPIGAIVTVITPTTVMVTVVATLVLLTGYSLDGAGATIAVRGDIEQAVKDYIDRLKPGEDVVMHNVRAQMFKVPGVYDVPAGMTLNGGNTNLAIGPTEIALTQTPITLS